AERSAERLGGRGGHLLPPVRAALVSLLPVPAPTSRRAEDPPDRRRGGPAWQTAAVSRASSRGHRAGGGAGRAFRSAGLALLLVCALVGCGREPAAAPVALAPPSAPAPA